MSRPKVDLHKRHPFDKELRTAISLAWIGVVVITAGFGEMIYFHAYQSAFAMMVAVATMVCSMRLLYATRSAYPMKPFDAWVMRRIQKRRAGPPASSR